MERSISGLKDQQTQTSLQVGNLAILMDNTRCNVGTLMKHLYANVYFDNPLGQDSVSESRRGLAPQATQEGGEAGPSCSNAFARWDPVDCLAAVGHSVHKHEPFGTTQSQSPTGSNATINENEESRDVTDSQIESSPLLEMQDFALAPSVTSSFSPAIWPPSRDGSTFSSSDNVQYEGDPDPWIGSPFTCSSDDELFVIDMVTKDGTSSPLIHPSDTFASEGEEPSGILTGPLSPLSVLTDELTSSSSSSDDDIPLSRYPTVSWTSKTQPWTKRMNLDSPTRARRRRCKRLQSRAAGQIFTRISHWKTRDGGAFGSKRKLGGPNSDFFRKLVECDMCASWYHYGCVGIQPDDVRLNNGEIYVCPRCSVRDKHERRGLLYCTRPGCQQKETEPGEFFVSRVIGRKLVYSEADLSFKTFYLMKWDGYPISEATWEEAHSMTDPGTLIEEFVLACANEGLSCGSLKPVLLREAREGDVSVSGDVSPLVGGVVASSGTGVDASIPPRPAHCCTV
ncbi:hypothetical protein AMATHDRAFT_62299 [Amanita thiersii Skay4041]|uniref:Chromo domain-containing protein n=1 Tax=Amanita thiersii Skay4041 TaxID=703135 RepID=A0A2A9NNI6_9AGAR|nr:hypothetical protein AMATHDRAFT_62299 [Amanita thiersii Skay4041]